MIHGLPQVLQPIPRLDPQDLIVPHPRMHERAFVIVPLLELDPDPLLPENRRVGSLRVDADQVKLFAPAIPVPVSVESE